MPLPIKKEFVMGRDRWGGRGQIKPIITADAIEANRYDEVKKHSNKVSSLEADIAGLEDRKSKLSQEIRDTLAHKMSELEGIKREIIHIREQEKVKVRELDAKIAECNKREKKLDWELKDSEMQTMKGLAKARQIQEDGSIKLVKAANLKREASAMLEAEKDERNAQDLATNEARLLSNKIAQNLGDIRADQNKNANILEDIRLQRDAMRQIDLANKESYDELESKRQESINASIALGLKEEKIEKDRVFNESQKQQVAIRVANLDEKEQGLKALQSDVELQEKALKEDKKRQDKRENDWKRAREIK